KGGDAGAVERRIVWMGGDDASRAISSPSGTSWPTISGTIWPTVVVHSRATIDRLPIHHDSLIAIRSLNARMLAPLVFVHSVHCMITSRASMDYLALLPTSSDCIMVNAGMVPSSGGWM